MAKQASRRRPAPSTKAPRRAKARTVQPTLDNVRLDLGSALSVAQSRGRDLYRSAENRFGRTPTVTLAVAGVSIALGALLLGMASRGSGGTASARGRRA